MSKAKPGFRVGQYFCSFPEGEFIKEDEDGNLFVMVDIFKINKDDSVEKIQQSELTPDVEEQINSAINTMLLEALENDKKLGDTDVKD
jgi:hypothetical protein